MAGTRLTVSPIGRVSVDEQGFVLSVDEPFRAALHGLEGFSHLEVVFWCDQVDTPELRCVLECEQPYRRAPAKLGVFATRSPVRPNPIAITPVQVLSLDREAGVVRVASIDAEPGTPLLDIKPYHPCIDRVRSVSVPDWCAHWPQWLEESAEFDWAGEFVNAR
jgi:tRNA-Thr(GGU) m(6)t(6)A37 methyltransferase TsaA